MWMLQKKIGGQNQKINSLLSSRLWHSAKKTEGTRQRWWPWMPLGPAFYAECCSLPIIWPLTKRPVCRVLFFVECQTLGKDGFAMCNSFAECHLVRYSAKRSFAECLIFSTWQIYRHSAMVLFLVVRSQRVNTRRPTTMHKWRQYLGALSSEEVG